MNVLLPHSKYSNLSLSPLTIDDASEIVTILNDEETIKYLIGLPYPVSIEWVKLYISSRPSVNGFCLAFTIRHNGKLIGEICIVPRTIPYTYELGYYLSRSYWNNGITTMAVNMYLNLIVKRINIGEDITIEAKYLVDNLASEKVLKKCRFIEIGRENQMKNGKNLQFIRMTRIIPDRI